MQQIQFDIRKIPTVMACGKCGGPVRLIGSEPHPVAPATDVLTYSCTVCEAFEVMPVPVAGA